MNSSGVPPGADLEIKRCDLPASQDGLGVEIVVEQRGTHNCIIAQETMPGSLGEAAGLRPGDIIFSINDMSLVGASLDEAARALQICKATHLVQNETDLVVELPKAQGGHGVSFVEQHSAGNGSRVLIRHVTPGTAAHSDGRLRPGQMVVSIQGHSVLDSTAARATSCMTRASLSTQPTVQLVVRCVTFSLQFGTHGDADPRAHARPRGSPSQPRAGAWSPTGSHLTNTSRVSRDGENPKGSMPHHAVDEAFVMEKQRRLQAEKDYDEIISLLEAEVAHLRSQLLAGPNEMDHLLIKYRQRCLVLGCQLNKAVASKRVADQAIARLLQFVRESQSKLRMASHTQRGADHGLNQREDGTLRHLPSMGQHPPSAGPWAVGDSCLAPFGNRADDMRTGTITVLLGASVSSGMACEVRFSSGDIQQCLAARLRPLASDVYAVEASRASGGGGGVPGGGGFLSQAEVDILKGADTTLNVVTDMLKDDVLPFGWEEAYDSDGHKYYIDHNTQSTSWVHPSTLIADLDSIPYNVGGNM